MMQLKVVNKLNKNNKRKKIRIEQYLCRLNNRLNNRINNRLNNRINNKYWHQNKQKRTFNNNLLFYTEKYNAQETNSKH